MLHTQTYPEAYLWKCKLLKKLGKIQEASELAKTLQRFDTADRCLTKFALKFMFKNNDNELGDKLFKTFMPIEKNIEGNVHNLQKFTYEYTLASSYYTELKIARTLRLLSISTDHIREIFDDQYDFYSYSLRNYYLRNLVEIIRFNDQGIKSLSIYLKIHYKYLKTLHLLKNYREFEQFKIANKLSGFSSLENDQEETNVIFINYEKEEIKSMDGKDFIQSLDINKEIEKVSIQLLYMSTEKSNKKRILKSFSILFEYYINTPNYLIIIKLLKFLMLSDNGYENNFRLNRFENKLKSEEYSKIDQKIKLQVEKFTDNLDSMK